MNLIEKRYKTMVGWLAGGLLGASIHPEPLMGAYGGSGIGMIVGILAEDDTYD